MPASANRMVIFNTTVSDELSKFLSIICLKPKLKRFFTEEILSKIFFACQHSQDTILLPIVSTHLGDQGPLQPLIERLPKRI